MGSMIRQRKLGQILLCVASGALFGFMFLFVLTGCGSKKFYTPANIQSDVIFERMLPASIVSSDRYGAMLKDDTIITKHGLLPKHEKIPKNARFLRESGGFYVFAKGCESLKLVRTSLIDESAFSQATCSVKEQNTACSEDEIEIPVSTCALSASIKDNLLAIIGNDNSATIIDINTKAQKFSQKGSSVLAVNELIAAPLFLESLVVFPTLDGRLLVVSSKTFSPERNIIISSDKFFNNVIFLEGDEDRIFAATPKKLISIVAGQEFSHLASIKDVRFYKGFVYMLSLDGLLAQFDHTLRVVNSEKFPYAKLEGMSMMGNMLYTFESHGGYIITLSLTDFSHKVYRMQDSFGRVPANKLNFYSGDIFYYDRYYVDLNGLR
ncbi:hypothetical protein [Helicobacter sp.]|uniref:hypothetical protein n=1 Tax=Helicobacter sp. TaxID=218 RepID=UPI00388E8F8C